MLKLKIRHLAVVAALFVAALPFAQAQAQVNRAYIQQSANEIRSLYGVYSQPTVFVDGGTSCPGPATTCNARTIRVDTNFLVNQEQRYGRYVAKNVIAHEWGHTIQFTNGIRLQAPKQELQADCFAGNFDKYAETNLRLPSYIEGAVRSARAAAGDVAHGTPQQRDSATRRGYQLGVQSCFAIR